MNSGESPGGCAWKWVNRWRPYGELGSQDRSAAPHRSPRATPAWVTEKVEIRRRECRWTAFRDVQPAYT
ncbi:leucine zipper domain-containing protein [Streptomyces sp. NRRL S-1521]|uniref:leucine zipper domain-containing protein n=1 Tax=Streptomyces sp. NRRL S-1521 TaxID=1609100 RepID=UPI00099E9E9B